MKKISILGCGWLGMPLAQFLISKGFDVKGSTTSVDKLNKLEGLGIKAFTVILNPDLRTKHFEKFLDSDILLIDIPPGRVEDKIIFHTAQINEILQYLEKSSVKKVIYISSTSVYGEDCGLVTEDKELNPVTEGGKAVKEAEDILKRKLKNDLTIIRFGGLIGKERQPGRFFSFKNIFEEGKRPVNLIHQKDCINIIHQVIEQNKFGEIYNGVCSEHPNKEEFYTKAAEKIGVQKPVFHPSEERNYKIVDNSKLKTDLKYSFFYDNPFKMLEG